jgi:hypothetical protein
MLFIAPLLRRLNDGVDYATFREAWLPDEILTDDPRRRVISAVNLEDPQELLTVALTEASGPEEFPVWMDRMRPIEARRHQRIKDLIGEPLVSGMYRVVAEDDLSRPITR